MIVRTVAEGKRVAELDNELRILLSNWDDCIARVQKSTTLPILAHEETGRTVSMLRDLFNPSYENIYVNDEKVLKGRNRRFGAFLHSRRAVVGLTAAVLVAVVALGGVVGVNAERNGGFFHWIQRDDTGITVITNPSGLNVEMVEKSTGTYYRLEDVPESFRKYVLRQEDLVMLEGFTFEQVEISQMSNFVKISSLYTQEETHNELRLGMICFANVVSYNRYDFLDSKYLYSTEKDGIELQVFSQEDEGEREYLVQFFFGEAQYYVQGEMSIDFLESFAEEYYDFVSN